MAKPAVIPPLVTPLQRTANRIFEVVAAALKHFPEPVASELAAHLAARLCHNFCPGGRKPCSKRSSSSPRSRRSSTSSASPSEPSSSSKKDSSDPAP